MRLRALICAGLFAFSLAARASDPLVVKTHGGKLQGLEVQSLPGQQVRAFLGVPFAVPPVGALRWRPPQPAAKWKGTRAATGFGYRCMQPDIYNDMIFHDPGRSEDCLTLNVWTPAKDRYAKLPVMVWIYGGGYIAGSTSEGRQNGAFLAGRGVVVVTMNYRLGVFGFLALPAQAQEDPHRAAGNYGLMDQAAALNWVKRNIQSFGGDPHNVTLFGESAGAFSVSAQMASPLAQGLFARAIGESGGAFSSSGLGFPSLPAAEQRSQEFAQSAFGTDDLARLRAMSAEDLLSRSFAARGVPRIGPDVDGYFLPESIPAIYAAGKQAHVPLLAGWNHDEGSGQVLAQEPQPTVESMRTYAQSEFGVNADRFLAAYSAKDDAAALRAMEDLSGDRFIAFSTWKWIEAQVMTGGKPVYRYRFDLPSPGDKFHSAAMGAFHSDEIEYVFGTLDSRQQAAWRPEDRALSGLIQHYWTNFARSGDPNGPGLPQWPQYNAAGNWPVMHLDANSAAHPDQHRDRYLFLDLVWGQKE